MLEEITINPKNVSFLGDPETIRQLVEKYGMENGVVYGDTGVLALEITNDELSKKISEDPPKNAVIYKKPEAVHTKEMLKKRMEETYGMLKKTSQWNAEPGNVVMYDFSIYTTYCTDGKKDNSKDNSFGVAEGLKIVKLSEDASIEDIMVAENEIGNIHSYFIGDTLTRAHNGVFGAITHFLGNGVLTDEDLFKNKNLFIVDEEKVGLSEKGEYISDCLKETWDNTPSSIRSLCKMGLNKYLSELFATTDSVTLEDFQKYVKEKKEGDPKSEIHQDLEKKYAEVKNILMSGLESIYYRGNSYADEILDTLSPMLTESKRYDAKDMEKLEKINDALSFVDVKLVIWKKNVLTKLNTILEKLKPYHSDYDFFKQYANGIQRVQDNKERTAYRGSLKRRINRALELYELQPLKELVDNLMDSVSDNTVGTTEAKNYRNWKIRFGKTLSDLKQKEADKKIYAQVYRGSVLKQLEMIEKGEYIEVERNYENIFDTLENNAKNIRIKPGKNFKQINEFGVFCPMGLAEKWNTWKIEHLGNKYTLAKYFKNADNELLKISADSDGNFNVHGSASPDFDESTKNEIEMFEKIINRNVSGANKIRLGWEKIDCDSKKELPKTVGVKSNLAAPKPKEFRLKKSDERLLRSLKNKH